MQDSFTPVNPMLRDVATIFYDDHDTWKLFSPCGPVGDISQISRSLHISDWEGSLDVQELDKRNIRAVLCLNMREKPAHMIDKYIENGIKHKQIFIEDGMGANIMRYFPEIYRFIVEESDRHGVLIHCTAGISRSATAVASYLLRSGMNANPNMNLETVLRYMKSQRGCISPNPSFIKQLQVYETLLRSRR